MDNFILQVQGLITIFVALIIVAQVLFRVELNKTITIRKYWGIFFGYLTPIFLGVVGMSFLFSGDTKTEESFAPKHKEVVISKEKAKEINENTPDIKAVEVMKEEQKEDEKEAVDELDAFIEKATK